MTDSDFPKLFKNFLFIAWKSLGLPEPTEDQYHTADRLQFGPKRDILQLYRGEGKSWITGTFVPWCLAWDPMMQFMVCSGSGGKADEFSTFVMQLLTAVPSLNFLIPQDPVRWSKLGFDVEGSAPAAQDPSVKSKGIFGQLTGGRADIIIADDVETPNTSETQTQREKLLVRTAEFAAILKPDNVDRVSWLPKNGVKYLGTPQSSESIYNELPKKGYSKTMVPVRYPDPSEWATYGDDPTTGLPNLAKWLMDKIHADPSLVGKSVNPKRFGELELQEREAEYGKSGFMMQFMLNTAFSDSLEKPLDISDFLVMDIDPEVAPERIVWGSGPEQLCKDINSVGMQGDFWYRPMFVDKERFGTYTARVMAIDPSGKGKDQTAWAVGLQFNGRIYLPEITGVAAYSTGYSEPVLTQIAEAAKKHRVNKIVVEENCGGGLFVQLLQPFLRNIYPCMVEEVHHSRQKEVRIIESIEPALNAHKLVVSPEVIRKDREVIPEAPDGGQRYQCFHQLTRISRLKGCLANDDKVDVLAMLIKYMSSALQQTEAEENKRRWSDQFDKEMEEFTGQATNHLTWTSSSRHRI